jgi:hypothetical protein
MTTKRIIWTDDDGNVCRCTPSPEAMQALTGTGGMTKPAHIDRQTASYIEAGMGAVSASRLAEGFANGGLTETEALNLIRDRNLLTDARNVVVVEAADLPHAGSLRAAWRQDGATVPVFDMGRGRSIKTDLIRPERNKRLAALDVDYMRADESGNTEEKEKIAALKQKLRDLPVTIQSDLDVIDDPETLENYDPTWPTAPE